VFLVFSDFQLPIFIFFSVMSYLSIFLSINVKSSRVTKSTKTALMHSKLNRTISNTLMIRHSILFIILTIFFLYSFKGHSTLVWFNHLNYTNLNFIIYYLFSIIMLIVLSCLNNRSHFIKNIQQEYVLSISFLNLFLPTIFFSTNLLTFFFIIELVSCLILMQFIVGKDLDVFSSNKKTGYFNYRSNLKSHSYINVIFFQYWTSFFSSVLLVFSFLSYIHIFGTTEWVVMNFLMNYDLSNFSFNQNIKIIFTSIIFLISVFLKLGLAPVHFYKIEIYKGLPFVTILLYTIYFFFIFFLFFGMILVNYLSSAFIVWYNVGLLFLLIGVLVSVFLLFDISSIRAFFSYSTIVNSISFFILFISFN
jgi:hypothetical protein